MNDRVYCYPPDYAVLKNKLGFRDATQLDFFEREFVAQRIAQGPPTGDFDPPHLRAIHRHLFQDVYEGAGEIRTVEIAKGGNQFQFQPYIATGMADVHRRIEASSCLRNRSIARFSAQAGEIIGDINYVHPFREGNGRTLLLYLKQLAMQAGHPLDLRRIGKDDWMQASRAAHAARFDLMSDCIRAAIIATAGGAH